MNYTRREFGKIALGGLPAAAFLSQTKVAFGAAATPRPSSTWAGVKVGLNVPYSFGTRTAMTAEQILGRCVELGVGIVELRAQAIENSLGLPEKLVMGPAPSDYAGAGAQIGDIPGVTVRPRPPRPDGQTPRGTAGGRMPQTPEELAAYTATAAELGKWRRSVPMSKAKELRAKYEAAGVEIGIVKFDGIAELEGDELDYAFILAKTLGAHAISGELNVPAAKRLGQAADKHQLLVGQHAHLAGSPAIYEEVMSYGKFAGANLDIGHWIAGNYGSPIPFMKKHHERITHVHVKDRKKDRGPNVPFGEGDTPIKEVLQEIRDNHWPIPAIIEYEIPGNPGADRGPLIKHCMDYCRDCLLS